MRNGNARKPHTRGETLAETIDSVGYRASARAGHAWKGDWSAQQVGQ